MTTAVLIIHILIIIAMIGVILVQRSEGGGLGMGSAGGLMGARGASDFLTRTTAILATLFFVTSITLALLAKGASIKERSILAIEEVGESSAPISTPQAPVGDSGAETPSIPEVPVANLESNSEGTGTPAVEPTESEETVTQTVETPAADVENAAPAETAEPIVEAPAVASDEQ